MSDCYEGWRIPLTGEGYSDHRIACPALGELYCELGRTPAEMKDSCPFAPILRALPAASPEQIRQATRVLTGEMRCDNCEHGSVVRDSRDTPPEKYVVCAFDDAGIRCKELDDFCKRWTDPTDQGE